MKNNIKSKKSDNPNFSELSDSHPSDYDPAKWSDPFLSGSVSSGTECTGLMPTPPVSDAELEAYEELYPFSPGQVVTDKKELRSHGPS